MLSLSKCIKTFQTWLHYTRHFRRIGQSVAGPHYNNNRYAIKREIRYRVTSVLDGFDLATQTRLFSSNVRELAEVSRCMEKRGKCSRLISSGTAS